MEEGIGNNKSKKYDKETEKRGRKGEVHEVGLGRKEKTERKTIVEW